MQELLVSVGLRLTQPVDVEGRSEVSFGQQVYRSEDYADGTSSIYFGPQMPNGQEKNWIKTVPGNGWFSIFRFYGPLEPLYGKTWKLNDIEERK